MPTEKTHIAAAFSVIIVSLIVGTIAYHYIEGWDFIQSFYFSVTTLTTVGYGDVHPTTDFSRLFTSFYILFNVALVLASLGIIGRYYLERSEKRIIETSSNLLRHGKHPENHAGNSSGENKEPSQPIKQ
ncbi:MAG: potassium channel family protein [Candidatus Diapherotrites archaeon]